MGIFKRVKDIALADINEVLDKMENPIYMIKQYLRELEEQITTAKNALANQLIAERKFEALISELELIIEKRVRQANLALDRNDETIAQLAIEEKLICEKRLHVYQEQYQTVKQQIAILQESLHTSKALYDELQSQKWFLMSRANGARAMQNLNRVVASVDTDTVRKGFSRMEEKVWQMEARASADAQVDRIFHNSASTGTNPHFKNEVHQELERLKAERK
ncbi:PspA/IM30 family protein [Paenibacillus frigoriresistens]|uniref:PspA/IM30 family protein n=1 Tax=Paenibacillus alginolyticus TaxID=59839 RepID=UPI0015653793|nr:PspA/IM30 family protein [Paenibacillus frigoriresistens]NRF92910.1 PspA/IM30 family protein [Paenibacillus frigoriresistens]